MHRFLAPCSKNNNKFWSPCYFLIFFSISLLLSYFSFFSPLPDYPCQPLGASQHKSNPHVRLALQIWFFKWPGTNLYIISTHTGIIWGLNDSHNIDAYQDNMCSILKLFYHLVRHHKHKKTSQRLFSTVFFNNVALPVQFHRSAHTVKSKYALRKYALSLAGARTGTCIINLSDRSGLLGRGNQY